MRAAILALSSAFLASGCTRPETSAPLTDSVFVAVMGDIKRLQDSLGRAPDSAMRGAVLRKHRASAADVEATARIFAEDPEHAAMIWHAIDTRATNTLRPK